MSYEMLMIITSTEVYPHMAYNNICPAKHLYCALPSKLQMFIENRFGQACCLQIGLAVVLSGCQVTSWCQQFAFHLSKPNCPPASQAQCLQNCVQLSTHRHSAFKLITRRNQNIIICCCPACKLLNLET